MKVGVAETFVRDHSVQETAAAEERGVDIWDESHLRVRCALGDSLHDVLLLSLNFKNPTIARVVIDCSLLPLMSINIRLQPWPENHMES